MSKDVRVLIIDDHPGILEVTAEALSEHLNCTVDTAENGNDALKLCDQHKYDLICTDYMMPGLTGTEFIEKLRQSSNPNNKSKVYILTGNPEDAARNIGDLTDINIIKKVDGLQTLIDVLSQYFK